MPSQDRQGRKLLHIASIVANLPITGVEGHYQNSCRPRDGILWHWVSQVTRAPGERPAGVPLQQRKIGQHGTAIRLAQLLKGLPLELADALTT